MLNYYHAIADVIGDNFCTFLPYSYYIMSLSIASLGRDGGAH